LTCLKRRIGVDLDGVVRNLYHPLVNAIKRDHPKIKIDPIEKWTDYHIWNHFKLKGKPVDEWWFKQLWFDRYVEEVYHRNSFTYPWACEVLKKQKSKGHKVIFITAQPNSKCIGWTMYFISKWKIPFNEIHFTEYESKHKVECDVYIEDSPKQVRMLAHRNVFVYDQPWNRQLEEDNIIYPRFKSWLEIDKELNRRFQ